MRLQLYILLCILALTISPVGAKDQKIVVVVPSYNNEQFCLKNLETLFKQNYTNFHVIYIDDCSSDATITLVEQYINDNKLQNQITLIKNPIRCGALRNIYAAVNRYCNPHDIVALYDGDDWFATDQALSIISKTYQDPNIWTTYGNFYSTRHGIAEWCRPFEQSVIENRSYRQSDWHFGHLRTSYAWLFGRIALKDFLYEGSFYQMAWDQAIAHPLLEMADGRCSFIPEILYIYNEGNPINDWNVNGKLQHRLRDIILAQKPYEPLTEKPILSTKEYSICTIRLPLEKQEILNNEKLLNYDMLLFVDSKSQKESILQSVAQHAQLLDTTQAMIVAYATYENKTHTPRELRHSSYLWDTLFTFQVGWKPELQYTYKEYAWLLPTTICKENPAYIEQLINEGSSYQANSIKLAKEAGLLIIDEL